MFDNFQGTIFFSHFLLFLHLSLKTLHLPLSCSLHRRVVLMQEILFDALYIKATTLCIQTPLMFQIGKIPVLNTKEPPQRLRPLTLEQDGAGVIVYSADVSSNLLHVTENQATNNL